MSGSPAVDVAAPQDDTDLHHLPNEMPEQPCSRLDTVMKKPTAWAAITALPTAFIGCFLQDVVRSGVFCSPPRSSPSPAAACISCSTARTGDRLPRLGRHGRARGASACPHGDAQCRWPTAEAPAAAGPETVVLSQLSSSSAAVSSRMTGLQDGAIRVQATRQSGTSQRGRLTSAEGGGCLIGAGLYSRLGAVSPQRGRGPARDHLCLPAAPFVEFTRRDAG